MHVRTFMLWGLFALAVAAASGCSGSGTTGFGPGAQPTSIPVSAGLSIKNKVILPNLSPGTSFTYDIGAVDPSAKKYYLADRTNKSLDIVDTSTFNVTLVSGFTGQKSSNDVSGPDGVVAVPGGSVYVGDVNRVMVVDPNAATITATITTGTAGFRTDEGCYDSADKLVMFANPADSPPYTTWISTSTNKVVAKLLFTGSAGLEACVYDPGTKNFFINNDGTPAHPDGELDVIPASSVVAGAPTIAASYAETGCSPTGLDLGPSEHLIVGCDTAAGTQQFTLVMSATSGSVVAKITQVGGEDSVAYDSSLNRYYTASRNWTFNGISSTGVAGANFTPVLGIIDAGTNKWIANITTGTGSHSVATDSSTGNVYVPLSPTATTYGGVQIYGP